MSCSHIRFVDLDHAREQLAPRQHHRTPKLVPPRPRGLVATQPEHALKSERGDALLLIDDVPGRREPAHQRRARPGENRARGDGRLRAAHRAAAQPVAHLPPASVDRSAEATPEPAPPSQFLQVANARRIAREPAQQLVPVTRIPDAGSGLIAHATNLGPAGDGSG